MTIRVAVLTVSDLGAEGKREDTSGDAIVGWAEASGYDLAAREIVADETDLIGRWLTRWADEQVADVIITTGGTGLGPRDVTPEATQAVLDKVAPGIAERIRYVAGNNFPRAALSRGLSGVRGSALIVNLPGSPGGVKDGLQVLGDLVDHTVQLLRGEPTDH
jgi:molybdopterin adenylyltransferase